MVDVDESLGLVAQTIVEGRQVAVGLHLREEVVDPTCALAA